MPPYLFNEFSQTEFTSKFFVFSDPDKKDDAFYTREREIEEIESLVPEIREKIADTRDMQTETNKKLGDKV